MAANGGGGGFNVVNVNWRNGNNGGDNARGSGGNWHRRSVNMYGCIAALRLVIVVTYHGPLTHQRSAHAPLLAHSSNSHAGMRIVATSL